MTGTPITIGRIVHYTLTADDATRINRRRAERQEAAGNRAEEDQVYPATVVRVFDGNAFTANLQVHLDGNDTQWLTSIQEGERPGTWAWPPRV